MSLNSFSYSPHPNFSSILVGPLLLAGFNRGATEITQFWVCLATPIRYFPTPATQAHLVFLVISVHTPAICHTARARKEQLHTYRACVHGPIGGTQERLGSGCLSELGCCLK